MQEALYYKKGEDKRVKCMLCPWFCDLKDGQFGVCKVRKNNNGTLETLVYNKLAAFGIDPIEKKPLYHFHPGKNILSIGLTGCNLHCTFCQNHNLSQCQADSFRGFIPHTPAQLLNNAKNINNNIGIAYTYNEPFTFFEFMIDTARLMHNNGFKNVVVSNGYVASEPLKEILPFIDAFNIDLKSFDDKFYLRQTKGNLKPVLDTIRAIARHGRHLELTYLVIPNLNDDEDTFQSMLKWIVEETGPDTPLHLSRYFPHYEMDIPATSPETLIRLHNLAKSYLNYAYIGNMNAGKYADTVCPNCSSTLIHRNWHSACPVPGFQGSCPSCSQRVPVEM